MHFCSSYGQIPDLEATPQSPLPSCRISINPRAEVSGSLYYLAFAGCIIFSIPSPGAWFHRCCYFSHPYPLPPPPPPAVLLDVGLVVLAFVSLLIFNPANTLASLVPLTTIFPSFLDVLPGFFFNWFVSASATYAKQQVKLMPNRLARLPFLHACV
jgi:hypothetical protein